MPKFRSAVALAACALLTMNVLARAGERDDSDLASQATDNPYYLFLLDTAPASPLAPASAPAPASQPALPDHLNLPPAVLDSPPFPSSDWTGPDPLIGTGDTITVPGWLEGTIKGTTIGDALAAARIHPYGWIDIGGNYSSSKNSNQPESYDLEPNAVVLDQFVFRFDRIENTNQIDHVDWGMRISLLYGIDYRYTVAKGYFDNQLFSHNELYGFDFPECYGVLYIPTIAEGMCIKVGRYISPADIEAQLAPQNYMYSHSLLFSVDPYTYTGINSVTKLSKNVEMEFGIHFGNDMAPWVDSEKLNGLAMLRWCASDGNDCIYAGVNAIGNGKYQDGHDDLQQIVATWGHRIDERWHLQTEVWYMWMYHALTGSDVIGGPSYPYAPSGAGTPIKGIADEWAFVNYIEYKVDTNTYAQFRTDILDDMKGQRTGYRTAYDSLTFGISHNFTPWLTMRPEIRWDHSWALPTYDDGKRKNQYSAACDIIIWF